MRIVDGSEILKLSPLVIAVDRCPVIAFILLCCVTPLSIKLRTALALIDAPVVHTAFRTFRTWRITHAPLTRLRLGAPFIHRLRAGALMNGRLALDPLLGERPPINPLGPSGALQRLVSELLPALPQLLSAAFLAGANDPLAGPGVPVPKDKVRMRVSGVFSFIVERRKPGGPALGDVLGEVPDQFYSPGLAQLLWKGEHDLVDDAGVLAVLVLAGPQVLGDFAGGLAGQARFLHQAHRPATCDVVNVCGSRIGFGLGGFPYRAMVQAVNRHLRPLAVRRVCPANP